MPLCQWNELKNQPERLALSCETARIGPIMTQGRLPLHLLLVVVCSSCLSTAFATSSFEVKGSIGQIALKAQSGLPKIAKDGLLEAQRKPAKWLYAFNIRIEKAYCDQVRVTLEQINASQSKVTVEVVRVRGGLLRTSARPLPAEESSWTRRVRQTLR